jgi:hypothetical protein
VRFWPSIVIVSLENKKSNKHLDLLSISVFLPLSTLMLYQEVS